MGSRTDFQSYALCTFPSLKETSLKIAAVADAEGGMVEGAGKLTSFFTIQRLL